MQSGSGADEQSRQAPAETVTQEWSPVERLDEQAAEEAAYSSCNDCSGATLEEQFRWPGREVAEGIDQAQGQCYRDPQEQTLQGSCQKRRSAGCQPPEEPPYQGAASPADGTVPDKKAKGHCGISRTHSLFILEGAGATGKQFSAGL